MPIFFLSETGTAADDFIFGHPLQVSADNTLTGLAGDDLIYGDYDFFISTTGLDGNPQDLTTNAQIWSTAENADVEDANVPHTSVIRDSNVGNGSPDVFSVTTIGSVTQILTVDIDYGEGPIGTDAELDFEVVALNGGLAPVQLLKVESQDSGSEAASDGDPLGVFALFGNTTYAIRVFTEGSSNALANSSSYVLNVSLTGQEVTNDSPVIGNDELFGGADDDVVYGGGGTDTLFGGLGSNKLDGGSGNDLLVTEGTTDSLFGGDGDDEITLRNGVFGAASAIFGGEGVDVFTISSNDNQDLSTQTIEGIATLNIRADASEPANSTNRFLDRIVLATEVIDFGGGDIFSIPLINNVDIDPHEGESIEIAINAGTATFNVASLSLSGLDQPGDRFVVLGGNEANTIIGTDLDDIIESGGGADSIEAGGGNDIIVAGISDIADDVDTVFGGDGDDVITGGFFVDSLFGGAGNDRFILLSNDLQDNVDGGTGLDSIDASQATRAFNIDLVAGTVARSQTSQTSTISNVESFFGGSESDSITGDANLNFLFGGGGNDTIMAGRGGADRLSGGDGFDILTFEDATGAVGARLDGGANFGVATGAIIFDAFEMLIGSDFNDVLVGSDDVNTINGGLGNDSYFGGLGNDVFNDGGGSDVYNGGLNSDSVIYSSATSSIFARLDGFASSGAAAGDTFISIENLFGTQFDDVLIGSTAANNLLGGAGNDRLLGLGGINNLRGEDGNDVLVDGGTDRFFGGAGSDTVTYASATGAVGARLDGGVSFGRATGDTFDGIENLIGTQFNDTFVGDEQDNFFVGGLGVDRFFGGDGSDTVSFAGLTGAAGVRLDGAASFGIAAGELFDSIENVIGTGFNDVLVGNDSDNLLNVGTGGIDRAFGGDGNDTVSYADATGAAGVRLDGGVSFGQAAGDSFDSIENIIGSAFNDILVGNDQSNTLNGGTGGDDRFFGGGGSDTVSYANATGSVGARLDGGANFGEAAGDIFDSIENLIGSAFNDVLVGGSSSFISGGAGNDTLFNGANSFDGLIGGLGDDLINVASGTGSLIIYTQGDGSDRIVGLDASNDDNLNIDGFGFTGSQAQQREQFLALGVEQNGDVLFNFDDGGSILVEDVTKAELETALLIL
ncbi:MAG: calcium-binding protein [Pseudomonadota bacterium]